MMLFLAGVTAPLIVRFVLPDPLLYLQEAAVKNDVSDETDIVDVAIAGISLIYHG